MSRYIFILLLMSVCFPVSAIDSCQGMSVYIVQNGFPSLSANDDGGCQVFSGISIGGGPLSASQSTTVPNFINATKVEVDERLSKFLKNREFDALSESYQGFVMLDIEHPIGLRAAYRNVEDGLSTTLLAKAYARRLAVVRQAFPDAKLVVYGVLALGWSCKVSPAEEFRLATVQALIDLGAFKEADYAGVVLYLRGSIHEESNLSNHLCQMESFSRARKVLDIQAMKYLPILGARVYNKRSSYSGSIVSVGDDDGYTILKSQYERLNSTGLSDIAVWSSSADEKNHRNSSRSVQKIFSGLSDQYR